MDQPMNLRRAIKNVLAGRMDDETRDFLKDQVAGRAPFAWAVCNSEQTEPTYHGFGTAAEMAAFNEGFNTAEGWLEPYTFVTKKEAMDYVKENKDRITIG